MKGDEFLKRVGIEEKMRNDAPLTAEEKQYAIEHNLQGPKLCGYNDCKNQFGPGEGGAYMIAGRPVCIDCYFDGLGAEIERHPVGRYRPHGSDPGF